MRTHTRIYDQSDLADALAREEPDMPLPGLVDLRHKGPLLDQTQVLDQETLHRLRRDYEVLRGPIVSEQRDSQLTDLTTLPLKKTSPIRRVIGVLLLIAIAQVSWSVSRPWMAEKHVARAATQAAPVVPAAPLVVPAPTRELPKHAPAVDLPRSALDALAGGDRARAHRSYAELALHEREPGPFTAAAEILARELKAGE
jgi:hypothetical protein